MVSMRTNIKYVSVAGVAIATVFGSYAFNFYFKLKYNISNDPAIWGQFGDYIGGILNPLLSFVSIFLLIKSLDIQSEANYTLRNELSNNEKIEKLRSFEALLFNIINSQKSLFESFVIFIPEHGNHSEIRGVQAVLKIEEFLKYRDTELDDLAIREYLEEIDKNDHIFGIVRAFYVAIKIISDRLSDSEGFSLTQRELHYLTLINLTDFSQLRLIIICCQFLEYESVKYIRNKNEFSNILLNQGISFDLY